MTKPSDKDVEFGLCVSSAGCDRRSKWKSVNRGTSTSTGQDDDVDVALKCPYNTSAAEFLEARWNRVSGKSE